MGDSRKWAAEQEEEERRKKSVKQYDTIVAVDADGKVSPRFKFDEDRFIGETLEYIASTYGQHYVGEDKERTQVVDLWESLGSLDTTSRDTAIKYLSRYGKKGGYNKKDLMKAIHYTILLWYATEDKE